MDGNIIISITFALPKKITIMDNYLQLAKQNQEKARKLIERLAVIDCWKSIGAEINLVGSLKTGLLMKHRDIDFHIYTDTLDVARSFTAVSRLAPDPAVKQVFYTNLADTEEACLEWHAICEDTDGETWQIDMIHILKGSEYDGFFERVAQRIIETATPEMKDTILRLKHLTPDDRKIIGIDYYQAVIEKGITEYSQLVNWLDTRGDTGINTWMP